MPPRLIYDISTIDLSKDIFDQEAIRQANPQRGAMEQLNGILHVDPDLHRIIGYKNVGADEFWVEGHIPGRPLLPGVLMIEAAAQLASFYTRKFIGWKEFIGFGGVDDTKFRMQVPPGVRMLLVGHQLWHRHRRIQCHVQGVVDGAIAFDTLITGTQM